VSDDTPQLVVTVDGDMVRKVGELVRKSSSKDATELVKKALTLYGAVLQAVEAGECELSLEPLGQNLSIKIQTKGMKRVK